MHASSLPLYIRSMYLGCMKLINLRSLVSYFYGVRVSSNICTVHARQLISCSVTISPLHPKTTCKTQSYKHGTLQPISQTSVCAHSPTRETFRQRCHHRYVAFFQSRRESSSATSTSSPSLATGRRRGWCRTSRMIHAVPCHQRGSLSSPMPAPTPCGDVTICNGLG